jgi:hypothetical protein
MKARVRRPVCSISKGGFLERSIVPKGAYWGRERPSQPLIDARDRKSKVEEGGRKN